MWDDIVLPEATRQQLIELQQQVAQQTKVYEAWGFGEKLSRGRGISALFSGSSGTGKTMAAEIMAGALELELYRIDLSCVVSKYIGETEKNLARVSMKRAQRRNLGFSTRPTRVRQTLRSERRTRSLRQHRDQLFLAAHEDYQGLAILATNMRQALDEAFMRRLRFLIEFRFRMGRCARISGVSRFRTRHRCKTWTSTFWPAASKSRAVTSATSR